MDQETMQQVQELLGQMRDIHAPVNSWWPPAPGWWIVALLAFVATVWLLIKFLRGKRQYRWINMAQSELADLRANYQSGEVDARRTVAGLSVLMRRSAIAALGRERVARATDEQWIRVISDVGNGHFSRSAADLLVSAPYRQQAPSEEQLQSLFNNCDAWLAGARTARSPDRVV